MASGRPDSDERATYDYSGGDHPIPENLQALADIVQDIRFDQYTRQLYATDASVYEQTPIAVAFPRSTAEVSALMEACADRGVPVLPRGVERV